MNKNIKKIPIVLASDNNYAMNMCVTMASVLCNQNRDELIHFYILDAGIANENKIKINKLKEINNCIIEFISADGEIFKEYPIENRKHLSRVSYYRLLIPQIINENKLIYLDCDTIVRVSLAEFYNTCMDEYWFAGSDDINSQKHTLRLGLNKYINSGVLLINCEKIRNDNKIPGMFDFITKNMEKFECHDQDIINMYFNDRILVMSKLYNVQISDYINCDEFIKLINDAKIYHYITRSKPWSLFNSVPAKKEFYKYIKKTPYKNFIFKRKFLQLINFAKGLNFYRKKLIVIKLRKKQVK